MESFIEKTSLVRWPLCFICNPFSLFKAHFYLLSVGQIIHYQVLRGRQYFPQLSTAGNPIEILNSSIITFTKALKLLRAILFPHRSAIKTSGRSQVSKVLSIPGCENGSDPRKALCSLECQ